MNMIIPSQALNDGGSGRGLSYWKHYLECSAKLWFEEKEKEEAAANTAPQDFDFFSAGKPLDHLLVGSLMHKLREIYYSGEYAQHILLYEDGEIPEWHEALRLMKFYMSVFPSNEFTDILAVEKQMDSLNPLEVFCCPEFSGKADLLVRVDEANAAALYNTRPELGHLLPGVYLEDLKTASNRTKIWKDQMISSPQFTGYAMLLEELEPELYKEFRGTIVTGVFKHKDLTPGKSLTSVYIPPPRPLDKRVLRQFLEVCYTRQINEGFGRNPMRCYDYFKKCPYFDKCRRGR